MGQLKKEALVNRNNFREILVNDKWRILTIK